MLDQFWPSFLQAEKLLEPEATLYYGHIKQVDGLVGC